MVEFGRCPQKSDILTKVDTIGFSIKSKTLHIKSEIGAIAERSELMKPTKLMIAIIGVLIIFAKTE